MHLLITADIHHDRDDGRLTAPLAEQLAALARPDDVVVLAGDLGGRDGAGLADCLAAFAGVGRARAFVPGNHDLWVHPSADQDSRARYDVALPAVAEAHGYQLLDTGPLIVDDLAIVGGYGGYDFSLSRPEGHPEAPAIRAGWATGQYEALRWNDYRFILEGPPDDRRGIPPAELCAGQCARLAAQLATLEADPTIGTVVVVTHTASHRVLIDDHPVHHADHPPAAIAWFEGVLGSATLGQIAAAHSKVRLAVCGHTHHPREHTDENGRTWLNVGSGYERKCWVRWSLTGGVERPDWVG